LITGFPQRLALVASAAVVHELSNPLAAMTMAVSEASGTIARMLASLQHSAPGAIASDMEWLKELHDEVGAGLTQLNAMLRRMREGAKPESIEGACNLRLVVESAVLLMRRQLEPHARLEVACDASIEIGLDPSVVAEIVINLILNASQAMATAGLSDRTIRIEGRNGGSGAELTVAADGPGIAAEDLEHLFDARFSTRGEHGGLGLLIVHDLVRRAGGTIRVESGSDPGTRFHVCLPRGLGTLSE
jgi:signal transduction histidine kinase